VTDETPNPTAPEADRPVEPRPGRAPLPVEPRPGRAPLPGHAPLPPPTRRPSSADTSPRRPEYRGEELDPERGPGLGCFWFQVIVLGFFIVIIPIGLNLNWPFELLAILLFVVIGLLLLTGQTVIFLLRLVAADRRAQGRRRPLASPTRTVGELEDEVGAEAATEPGAGARAEAPEADAAAADRVQPVDPESIIRAPRLNRSASASPREPAAGDDGAVPSAGGAAASMPAAMGERSSEAGMSDASPPAPMQGLSTAGQRAAPEEATEPAAAEPAESETAAADIEPGDEAPPADAAAGAPAESETAAADIEPGDAAPPADAAAGAPADPEEPDPGVRQ
jgi:hypothetical protein